MTPNGKTIYVLTPRGVIPIRTGSRTVLPMIKVPKLANFTELAITPDGRTIYVGAAISRIYRSHGRKFRQYVGGGVVPISTATNMAGRFISLGGTPVSITFGR
jgi:DNA-binding beta-propeller fold protein YncE